MRIVRGSQLNYIPAAHEDPIRPGVLKRVLATRDELIAGRLQMINWAMIPAGASFQPHYHQDMQEVFIILSGRVEITVDGIISELAAGDAVFIDPHEVHCMRNPTEHSVEFVALGISTGQGGQTILVDG